MSDHDTLRLPHGTPRRLEHRAKRCGRAPGSVAQRYEFREEIDEEIALNHAECECGHTASQSGRRRLKA